MEQLYRRLGNLMSVKSLVTLALTGVFAWLTCSGGVTAEQFLTVFTVVIAFYFGTQNAKGETAGERQKTPEREGERNENP